jgi:hypothetical protein
MLYAIASCETHLFELLHLSGSLDVLEVHDGFLAEVHNAAQVVEQALEGLRIKIGGTMRTIGALDSIHQMLKTCCC